MFLSQKTGSASIKCEYLLFLVGYGFADRINPFKTDFHYFNESLPGLS
jgi:hypothetical protein